MTISIAHTFVVTTVVWGIVFTRAFLLAAILCAAADEGTQAEVTICAFLGCTLPSHKTVAMTPIPKIMRSIVPKTHGQISFLLKKSASAPGPTRTLVSVVANYYLPICAEIRPNSIRTNLIRTDFGTQLPDSLFYYLCTTT